MSTPMTGTRVPVITGGSRGIGAATARLPASAGWQVALTYRARADEAEGVVQAITRGGGKALAVQAEACSEADIARVFDRAEAAYGPVTGLVNNAGIDGGPRPLADMTIEELRQVLDTNVLGPMLFSREAVRRMRTDRGGPGGAIVNLGSVAARLGAPGERVHYAASKGAIASFTTGLAKEVAGLGIRVNCVTPGLTVTEMNPPDRIARITPTIPIGRPAEPQELAEVILFTLSPRASYMVGAELLVSCGR